MHAMEIVNYSSYVNGCEEHNSILFDNMLHNGEDIYCIATDDNHNGCSIDSPCCDSFGGFTMIKADKLEYGTITKALIDGSFYASEGPSIYDLYYDTDDGLFHITTSDAVRIVMSGGKRYNNAVTPNKKGETITEASFNIGMLGDGYVRFTVRDKNGKEAYTNAYNVSKILSKIKNND
jgi:hypothetical protein